MGKVNVRGEGGRREVRRNFVVYWSNRSGDLTDLWSSCGTDYEGQCPRRKEAEGDES